MSTSNVAVVKTPANQYPLSDEFFRPDRRYPEYPFDETAQNPNYVYDSVRTAFQLLELDSRHFGSTDWNPLAEFVSPGNTVLIKPNLVMDANGIPEQGTQCLYTQPSVVAAVVDYVVIALKGHGKIVIGDAPMQECRFDRLVSESGYDRLVDFYRSKGIDIDIVDFRELTSVVINGVHHSSINENASGRIVNLGCDSEFACSSPDQLKRMRVTNYDPTIMPQHHNESKHEYYISDYVLNADVIINMPKPKTHRKAGATISLKNLVGVNVRKEFLPHHTMGSTAEGGDEYSKKNYIHKLRSYLYDKRNIWQSQKKYALAGLTRYAIRGCSVLLKLCANRYSEGSWYGNHTISRTITDLNKIVLYADRNGILQSTPQRKIMIVADMIISGEKEGPVFPTAKPAGIIAAGTNPVCFDETVATLMGFDISSIPTLSAARKAKAPYVLSAADSEAVVVSNSAEINQKKIADIPYNSTLKFEPSSGWKGHIELNPPKHI